MQYRVALDWKQGCPATPVAPFEVSGYELVAFQALEEAGELEDSRTKVSASRPSRTRKMRAVAFLERGCNSKVRPEFLS